MPEIITSKYIGKEDWDGLRRANDPLWLAMLKNQLVVCFGEDEIVNDLYHAPISIDKFAQGHFRYFEERQFVWIFNFELEEDMVQFKLRFEGDVKRTY